VLAWGRLLEVQFEAHHEVHPPPTIGCNGVDHRDQSVALQARAAKDVSDLLDLVVAQVVDFPIFSSAFRLEVLSIRSSGIYAGFHYRFSTVAGQDMGRKIAELTIRTQMPSASGAASR
jgi:hypothetical protein